MALAITVLLALIFSKYFYLASITSYYTFYLIDHFQRVGAQLPAAAVRVPGLGRGLGGMIGGPLGDRLGAASTIIWVSILGVLPFTLLLPHANLFWTALLTVPIGLILSSAFPAIVVYAQDLLPGRTGTVAGLFFGLAFGMGSVGAAVLGHARRSRRHQHSSTSCAPSCRSSACSTALLPDVQHRSRRAAA